MYFLEDRSLASESEIPSFPGDDLPFSFCIQIGLFKDKE